MEVYDSTTPTHLDFVFPSGFPVVTLFYSTAARRHVARGTQKGKYHHDCCNGGGNWVSAQSWLPVAGRRTNCSHRLARLFSPRIFFSDEQMPFSHRCRVLSILENVHERGWLHSDISPGNITATLVRSQNKTLVEKVFLIDFGLAERWRELGRAQGRVDRVWPRRSVLVIHVFDACYQPFN